MGSAQNRNAYVDAFGPDYKDWIKVHEGKGLQVLPRPEYPENAMELQKWEVDEKVRIKADIVKAVPLRQALSRQIAPRPSAAQASEPSGSGKHSLENDSDDTSEQPQSKKSKGNEEG